MSSIEKETIIVPWVGPASYKNVLSVVVLSSNIEIIEKISEVLSLVHSKTDYRWKLIVLQSCSLEDIIKRTDITGTIAIDFVILALDTSRIFCVEWTKKVIEQVHPDLRNRRVVLVNASGLPPHSMAVTSDELISLYSDLKVDMINGNVYKPDDAANLARRLLKYIEVSIGVKTGIPNINV